jgi:hypothetical protein
MGICSNLIKYKYSNCLEKLFGFKKKKTKAIPYTFDTIFEFHKKKKNKAMF